MNWKDYQKLPLILITHLLYSQKEQSNTSGNPVVAVTMPEAASSAFVDMQRLMISGFDLDLSMNVLSHLK